MTWMSAISTGSTKIGAVNGSRLMRPLVVPIVTVLFFMGCSSTRLSVNDDSTFVSAEQLSGQDTRTALTGPVSTSSSDSSIKTVSHSDYSVDADTLENLQAIALTSNPALRRLQQEVAAAHARARYADKLPDPMIGANVFAAPIETAAGSQRANLSLMQMVPWLERLDAQQQQACLEAMAMKQLYDQQRLQLIADLRTQWYRLYVLEKQQEIIQANRRILESLVGTVTARLTNGTATAGDVTALSVELGRLEQQVVMVRQQIQSTVAEINRLTGRPSNTAITPPESLSVELPDWSHDLLRDLAWQHHPALAHAQLKAQATRWGIEVAELRRRPDVTLNASWFAIDNNRPASAIVDIGQDAWSLGAQVTVPLGDAKYNAIRDEARWKHQAAHASVAEVRDHLDSRLRDLWEQARAASETAALFRDTIRPQAQQTLESDQQALANGSVDFDRVLKDVRDLLTLELGLHRAIGEMATSIAGIDQLTALQAPH